MLTLVRPYFFTRYASVSLRVVGMSFSQNVVKRLKRPIHRTSLDHTKCSESDPAHVVGYMCNILVMTLIWSGSSVSY